MSDDLVTLDLPGAVVGFVLYEREWGASPNADAREGAGVRATYEALRDAPRRKAGFGYRYTVTAPRGGLERLASYLEAVGGAMSGGGFDPGEATADAHAEGRVAFVGARAIRAALAKKSV